MKGDSFLHSKFPRLFCGFQITPLCSLANEAFTQILCINLSFQSAPHRLKREDYQIKCRENDNTLFLHIPFHNQAKLHSVTSGHKVQTTTKTITRAANKSTFKEFEALRSLVQNYRSSF